MEGKSLQIGSKVRITGGKYKKFKQGYLRVLKPTYCDVEFWNEDFTKKLNDGQTKKVKITYIHPLQEMVIEMPEAEQLLNVDIPPDQFIEQMDEKKEHMGYNPPQQTPAVESEQGESEASLAEKDIIDGVMMAIGYKEESGKISIEEQVIEDVSPKSDGAVHMEDLCPESQEILNEMEDLILCNKELKQENDKLKKELVDLQHLHKEHEGYILDWNSRCDEKDKRINFLEDILHKITQ
jgi:hypothetical protein